MTSLKMLNWYRCWRFRFKWKRNIPVKLTADGSWLITTFGHDKLSSRSNKKYWAVEWWIFDKAATDMRYLAKTKSCTRLYCDSPNRRLIDTHMRHVPHTSSCKCSSSYQLFWERWIPSQTCSAYDECSTTHYLSFAKYLSNAAYV